MARRTTKESDNKIKVGDVFTMSDGYLHFDYKAGKIYMKLKDGDDAQYVNGLDAIYIANAIIKDAFKNSVGVELTVNEVFKADSGKEYPKFDFKLV